ncbi:NAD-dependent protein deacetylase sirtuin-3, mitochondrial [Denticeps clupeoides]|uniref:Deacetylase sirtuin-type domain-containing protein n=1 Tax=Denticeps clupeoides TaxID=299321 RepID=A0AAY4BN26_9TELE|nr:NAD-dependent protein deacetylase sirtuin-3, mitochondrial-like [Denticeps clupeoides]XP_028814152.1 NAD-dependent protein deacetylase sirtuin-3, mitochondrial-like [Denticeps clupeoides]
MSKAELSRDKRITRSSATQSRQADVSCPDQPAGRPGVATDSGLAQDLSMMSVNEQQSSLPRKGRLSKARLSARAVPSIDPRPQSLASTSAVKMQGTPISKRGMGTIARLMKLGRLRNVVVVAGAGISTASGIPDFRTPGTGLYANLKKYDLPYPEAIFNIDYFSNDPRPFFSLAKELYPGRHRPNYVHYFIRMLDHKGMLLRMYTQNIDGLEKMCGIPDDKLVEAHGSFATASCHLCYTPYPTDEAKDAIINDRIPTCSFCQATVKPSVVFFGEDLPEKYFLHTKDFPKADLLMIMGTSLQIEPFASLVNTVKSTVPRLLLNRDAVGPFQRQPLRRADYMELGDLVDSVKRLAEDLGWHHEIEHLMWSHENEAIPVTLVPCPPPVSTQQLSQQRVNGLGRRGAELPCDRRPPKTFRSGLPERGSGSEDSDSSEADSKSTESSGPSN